MKVDWSSFIVKNVISNLNYLMRIYRLTEQELNAHNPFFAQTPEAAKHNILKAELLRNYKLHVAVQQPLAYQRKLSTAILSRILKSNDFRSETVRSLTRECLTAYVFFPTMGFVDPYWVNYGITCALRGTATKTDETDAGEDGSEGGAAAAGKSEPPKSDKPKKHSSKTPGNSTTCEKVGYASLSTPSSRSTSPERSSAEPSSNGPDAASISSASMSVAPSALVVTDTEWSDPPPNPALQRKESLVLTSKMKAWDAEKQKRQEKRTARKQKHLSHSNSMGGDMSSAGMGLPHDDEVPTGLLSPQGAFSHSPNHAISPTALNSVPPSPSQLSSNWEVRIIGAGIRFDPKPFVMYQLLVKNGPSLKWTVVKRYSAFEELHAKLKKAIPSFEAQLPKKHFFGNLDQQFIANRKVELQTYLGQLLWNRTVQENADLQAFLLPSPDDAKWAQTPQQNGGQSGSTFSFFKNKKEKDEAAAAAAAQNERGGAVPGPNEDGDTFTSSDPRATDSPRTSRRHASATPGDVTGGVAAPSASPPGSPSSSSKAPLPRIYSADDLSNGASMSRGAGAAASSFAAGATGANPFPLATGPGPSIPGAKEGTWEDKSLTDPLYMLVEEVFNLNGRGWMRRQTTWVAKQLVKLTMDSLIKDKLNKSVESWMNEDVVSEHFDWICDIIWPKGVLYTPAAPPDAAETLRMKLEAQEMMRHSIPTALRAMLGKEHCLAAMEKFFQFLQMEPLIQHFVSTQHTHHTQGGDMQQASL